MELKWSGTNIIEMCSFIGADISQILIAGSLFLPKENKIIGPVPIGATIRKVGPKEFTIKA